MVIEKTESKLYIMIAFDCLKSLVLQRK